MIGGFNLKKLFWIIAFILFLSSGLYMTDFFNNVALLTLLATSTGLTFYFILLREKKFKINVLLLALMTLIFVSITISSLLNSDISLFYQALVIYMGYLSLGIMFNRMYKNESLQVTYKLILITQLPLVLTFVIGFDFPLQGIFYNPNAMGLTSATVYVVVLACLLANMEDNLVKNGNFLNATNLLNIILCAFLFLITIGSSSRTSTVAITIITVFSILLLVFKGLLSRKYKSTFKAIFASILIPAVLISVYNFPPVNDYLYYNILYKFEVKADSNNMLSTRDIVWEQTVNEATLFGNGRLYFDEQVGIQAHNTFISFLGQYGWLTLTLFVLFLLVSLRYALKFARRNNSNLRYLPLFLISAFVILSMAETMTHKAIMLAMFCAIGVVSVSSADRKDKLEKVA